mgnify:FL=1
MKRILGLDVSKSSVSCCLISKIPQDIKEFYYSYPFESLNADKDGIDELLALNADIAIVEPTGINYSRIWVSHLLSAGVEVRYVDHAKLRYYRERHLELPNKDDDADALALAVYGTEHLDNPRKFVCTRTKEITELRALVLRLEHINRIKTAIVNRTRQDLSWQFPENAYVRSESKTQNPPLLWGWLAGKRKSAKYDRLLQKSVGLGITNTVILHSKRLCDLHLEEYHTENKIKQILSHSKYDLYINVFNQFNFGLRIQSLLLTQVYPFERFLENNQPIVKYRKGRISGKLTARHLSERRFLKTLGVAPTQEYSGDSKRSKVKGGSALSKKMLWLWIFTSVEPKLRRTSHITQRLGKYLDEMKIGGKPVQLARSKTAALAAKLLFRKLVKELCD